MAPEPELSIPDWHAHVYFDADEADEAGALCSAMRSALGVAMGRVHRVPVGPHPRGSCQMTIPREQLGAALDWLVRHRGKFTVFMHGNSGNDLRDHTALVVWLGASEPLDLGIFS